MLKMFPSGGLSVDQRFFELLIKTAWISDAVPTQAAVLLSELRVDDGDQWFSVCSANSCNSAGYREEITDITVKGNWSETGNVLYWCSIL